MQVAYRAHIWRVWLCVYFCNRWWCLLLLRVRHIRQHSLAVDEEYVSDISVGTADGKLAKGENGTRTKNGGQNKWAEARAWLEVVSGDTWGRRGQTRLALKGILILQQLRTILYVVFRTAKASSGQSSSSENLAQTGYVLWPRRRCAVVEGQWENCLTCCCYCCYSWYCYCYWFLSNKSNEIKSNHVDVNTGAIRGWRHRNLKTCAQFRRNLSLWARPVFSSHARCLMFITEFVKETASVCCHVSLLSTRCELWHVTHASLYLRYC